jgi:hypothetical protein
LLIDLILVSLILLNILTAIIPFETHVFEIVAALRFKTIILLNTFTFMFLKLLELLKHAVSLAFQLFDLQVFFLESFLN